MSRITPVSYEDSPEASRPALDKIKASFGGIANIFGTLGNSAAALNGYLNFSQALSDGLINAELREQIALTVAGVNSCDYCASAHTTLGKMAGLSDDDIKQSLIAQANDAKTAAVLAFAKTLTENRGNVSDDDIHSLKEHGYCQGFIVEVIANVALNIFTNYLNHAAQTDIDFPVVSTKAA
ncbi:MAG: carboxymuconolactone decarboxylase family protein [Cellvibrionaceae bacterium]